MELYASGNHKSVSTFNCAEIDDSYDALIGGGGERPPAAKIKPAWKSSKVFLGPHSVTHTASQPSDKFNYILIAVLLHGIAVALPWNTLVAAESYFRDYKLNARNATEITLDHQKYFISYFGIASTVSSFIAMGFNVLLAIKSAWSLTRRITFGIAFQAVAIVLTISLAITDTSDWTTAFFYATLSSSVVLSVANGVHQNCVYGIVSFLPSKYSNIFIVGVSLSGLLASIFNVIFLTTPMTTRLSTIYYFVTLFIIFLFVCDCYYVQSLSRFYRYHQKRSKLEPTLWRENGINQCQPSSPSPSSTSALLVFRKCWKECFNLYLINLVSHSVYPSMLVSVKSVSNSLDSLPNKYFTPISCFIIFNGGATFGSLVTVNVRPYRQSKYMWILIALRLTFLPFYLFCNQLPDSRQWPVFITNDSIYMAANFCLGFTHGYFTSLNVMSAPTNVEPSQTLRAGMFSALFIAFGLFSGFILSNLLLLVIEIKIS